MKHPPVFAAVVMQPHDDAPVSLGDSVRSPWKGKVHGPAHGPLVWRLSGEDFLGGWRRCPLCGLVDRQSVVSVQVDAALQPGGLCGPPSHPSEYHPSQDAGHCDTVFTTPPELDLFKSQSPFEPFVYVFQSLFRNFGFIDYAQPFTTKAKESLDLDWKTISICILPVAVSFVAFLLFPWVLLV